MSMYAQTDKGRTVLLKSGQRVQVTGNGHNAVGTVEGVPSIGPRAVMHNCIVKFQAQQPSYWIESENCTVLENLTDVNLLVEA